MEILFAIGGLIVLIFAYLWGRGNGYSDGYFKGHSEKPATIEKYDSAATIRIAKAAYLRGYRKAVEDLKLRNNNDSGSGS